MLNKRIRQLRTEKKMTQKELGAILGVGKTTISQYESNTRKPDVETLKRLADYFCVSVDYLLGRTDTQLIASEGDSAKLELKHLLKEDGVRYNGVPLLDEDKQNIEEFLELLLRISRKTRL